MGCGERVSLPYDPDSWPANWILQLIAKDQLGDFYNSKQWKRFRLELLKSKPCRCQLCEQKVPAVLTPLRKPWEKKRDSNDRRPAAVVHHRNEIRQRPDLALSEYDDRGQLNTVIICPGCHWEEHHKRKLPVTEERW